MLSDLLEGVELAFFTKCDVNSNPNTKKKSGDEKKMLVCILKQFLDSRIPFCEKEKITIAKKNVALNRTNKFNQETEKRNGAYFFSKFFFPTKEF